MQYEPYDEPKPTVSMLINYWATMLIFLTVLSWALYQAPGLRIENRNPDNFQRYYELLATKDLKADAYFVDHIYPFHVPGTSKSTRRVPGVLSGNEHIALTSLLLNTASDQKPNLWFRTVLFFGVIACIYMNFHTTCHNVLSWMLRFYSKPSSSFVRYNDALHRELRAEGGRWVHWLAYIKLFSSALPACAIGFGIAWTAGEFSIYLRHPFVPLPMFIMCYVQAVLCGSLVVIFCEMVFRYCLLRFDVDVLNSHLDEIAVGILSVVINQVVFLNSLGTTVAVTVAVLFFTILTRNRKDP